MPTLQEQLQSAVNQAIADSHILHNIVHGDDNTSIVTESGNVKSVAKVLNETSQILNNSISTIIEMRDISVSSAQAAVESAELAEYAAQGHAETIHFSPSGNLLSTNVQSALVELDDKKINQSHIGINANQIVKLDNEAKLPAVDGSKLLNVFSLPVGTIIDFGGDIAPDGFLICDGSAVSRTTYQKLFTAISILWGSGDGVSTFNLPNLCRRTTIGSGGVSSTTIGNVTGNVGGTEKHTLITSEIPSHRHNIQLSGNAAPGTGIHPSNRSGYWATSAQTDIEAVGGDQPHNNMQPSAVVLKVIKY